MGVDPGLVATGFAYVAQERARQAEDSLDVVSSNAFSSGLVSSD